MNGSIYAMHGLAYFLRVGSYTSKMFMKSTTGLHLIVNITPVIYGCRKVSWHLSIFVK